MLVAALVMFTLPAAAVMIYASLRPLWAGSAHTDHAGLERTYRTIAIRAVIFVLLIPKLFPYDPNAARQQAKKIHAGIPMSMGSR